MVVGTRTRAEPVSTSRMLGSSFRRQFQLSSKVRTEAILTGQLAARPTRGRGVVAIPPSAKRSLLIPWTLQRSTNTCRLTSHQRHCCEASELESRPGTNTLPECVMFFCDGIPFQKPCRRCWLVISIYNTTGVADDTLSQGSFHDRFCSQIRLDTEHS